MSGLISLSKTKTKDLFLKIKDPKNIGLMVVVTKLHSDVVRCVDQRDALRYVTFNGVGHSRHDHNVAFISCTRKKIIFC